MDNPILKQYEERIVAWALAHASIRAIIACGSNERAINPGDEWADLDLELYVSSLDAFVADTDWIHGFGTLWVHLQLQEEDGPVFLLVFEGAHKVDLHFYLLAELEKLVASRTLHDSYERGYRVVMDKDSLAAKLPGARTGPPLVEKPTQGAFASEIFTFWYGAIYVAKQIRRRSLWVVKSADWRVKQSLLHVAQWHAQSAHGWLIDTWHDGKFMAQWSDPQTLEALHKAFGHFDAGDSWRALFATMDIFRRLGRELATNLNYDYSDELDHQVTRYIQELQEADNA